MKKLSKLIYLLVLIILTGEDLSAQDKAFTIEGLLKYDHISYFKDKSIKINNRNEGLLQLTLGSKTSKATKWKAVTELREDMSDEVRNRIWIDELWMKQTVGKMDFTIGKQIIAWGTADGYNPVNNINPIDYSDLIDTDDEHIGVYGLRGQFFSNSYDFDMFWSPFPTVGKLPELESRWFPTAEDLGLPTEDINFVINNKPPSLKITDGEVGLRFRKRFSGLDLAFSYYNGYDHLPEYITQLDSLEPNLIFRSSYRRQQVFGLETAIALPYGFGIRGEAALFIPEKNTLLDDRFIQTVAGFDRSFSIRNSNLLFIIQYMYDYNLEGNKYDQLDVRHIFNNSLMENIEWSFNNGLTINLISIYSLENKDYLIRSEFSYRTSLGLKISLHSDILEGGNNTFFGSYTDNDRIQCKINYMF